MGKKLPRGNGSAPAVGVFLKVILETWMSSCLVAVLVCCRY